MEILTLSTRGAYLALVYFSALPIVVALVFGVGRRAGWRFASFAWSSAATVAVVALLVAYYGGVWYWLFGAQFYEVKATPYGQWVLIYVAPQRTEVLEVTDITKVRRRPAGDRAARVVIETASGVTHQSAQTDTRYAEVLVDRLRDAARDMKDGRPVESAGPARDEAAAVPDRASP